MYIPEGHTEQSVTKIMQSTAKLLSLKFKFAYHDDEDIEQESICYFLEALPRYKPKIGPLEGFLWSHGVNRLRNKHRDTVFRTEPACRACHDNPSEGGHDTGDVCNAYKRWKEKNERKQSLAMTAAGPCEDGTSWEGPASEDESPDIAAANELRRLIDRELDLDLRADYLRMKDGAMVPKPRRKAVQAAIAAILKGRPTIGSFPSRPRTRRKKTSKSEGPLADWQAGRMTTKDFREFLLSRGVEADVVDVITATGPPLPPLEGNREAGQDEGARNQTATPNVFAPQGEDEEAAPEGPKQDVRESRVNPA